MPARSRTPIHAQTCARSTVLISSKSATAAGMETRPSAPQSQLSTGSATRDDVPSMARMSSRPPSCGSRRPSWGPYHPCFDRTEKPQKASAVRRLISIFSNSMRASRLLKTTRTLRFSLSRGFLKVFMRRVLLVDVSQAQGTADLVTAQRALVRYLQPRLHAKEPTGLVVMGSAGSSPNAVFAFFHQLHCTMRCTSARCCAHSSRPVSLHWALQGRCTQ